MVSLGFYIPSFHFVDYPGFDSVGHFSADRFDPPNWKPRECPIRRFDAPGLTTRSGPLGA